MLILTLLELRSVLQKDMRDLMMSSLIFLNNVKDGVDLSITITPDDTESRYFSKIVSKSELAGTGMSNAEYMQASVDQCIVLVKS